MVKVVMVTVDKDPVTLEFVDIYNACSVMKDLSDSVVGGCAFTVSFSNEETRTEVHRPKSRFINLKEV
jgi:hypothetical protein